MIEKILSKRHQVRYFDNKQYPTSEIINTILQETYRLVPSKQNLMPYKVHVLGPEMVDHKKELFKIASKKELPNDWNKRFQIPNTGNIALFAPYVLLFEKRCPEPNEFVKRLIANGHTFPTIDPLTHNTGGLVEASTEVGMFASVLTSLCLEQGISVSYTGCIPPYLPTEKFKFLNNNFVFLSLSLGYESSNDEYQLAKDKDISERVGETKPNVDEIISWV